MEEGIVSGMAGAALFEDGYGLVELEPFGDAEGEFACVFELFEGEEILPFGVVLNAGDAVGQRVVDGYGEGLAALFERRRRDFCGDEGVGGGLAEDAGGGAGGVAVDLGPVGSGVEAVMLAAARAAELATAMCSSTRRKMAGWPAVTLSRSVRVGRVAPGQRVWSQPPPRIQSPGLDLAT